MPDIPTSPPVATSYATRVVLRPIATALPLGFLARDPVAATVTGPPSEGDLAAQVEGVAHQPGVRRQL